MRENAGSENVENRRDVNGSVKKCNSKRQTRSLPGCIRAVEKYQKTYAYKVKIYFIEYKTKTQKERHGGKKK